MTKSRRVQQQQPLLLIPPSPIPLAATLAPLREVTTDTKYLQPHSSARARARARARTRERARRRTRTRAKKGRERDAPSTLRRPRTRIRRAHARPFGYISRAALIPARIQSHPLIPARSRRKKGKDETAHEDRTGPPSHSRVVHVYIVPSPSPPSPLSLPLPLFTHTRASHESSRSAREAPHYPVAVAVAVAANPPRRQPHDRFFSATRPLTAPARRSRRP